MRMPSSNSQHNFAQVPRANIPRSSFDRSHGYKTTLDAGYLVPVFFDECLPGDTFSLNMTGFARLATPLQPYMDNSYFNSFFFAVPIRLLWQNWEKFNGAQDTPGASTDYLVPQVVAPAGVGFPNGSVADYLGLPTGVPGISVSAFWFRAYNLIWNEWFRDQNLQAPVVENTGDGPDPWSNYSLLRRGKRHDYFTSSLPWPQKGESVSIPLGTEAPVLGIGKTALTMTAGTGVGVYETGQPGSTSSIYPSYTVAGSVIHFSGQDASTTGNNARLNIRADLSNATAATINQLRQAFQVQKLYERDARGGTRYTEIVRSHFGVVSPDARLQRPEYLGGGQSPIHVHQVEQTSSTSGQLTPMGDLAAFGTSIMTNHGFSKSFTEHCVILGLVSVRADLNYQQGINRMYSRRTRFDYYWPALAHIGEQAVLSKEIYADGTAGDETVWGYQERFAEYRYKPSVITGQLRSNYAQSLDTWHLAQDFGTRPLLNAAFIQDDPPFDRVIAVPSEPHFIADFHFKLRCARPMPVFGVPGLMDHF